MTKPGCSRFLTSFRRSTGVAVLLLSVFVTGCVPIVMGGGAVVGTMVAIDRRTAGIQLEDEGIELRAGQQLQELLGDQGHINVTSYNRQVLLTGEVPTAEDADKVLRTVQGVENVRAVVNDLAAMPTTNLAQRSNDAFITGKVRASLVDAQDLSAKAFKVVTERNVVYLLGRVTERESTRAAEIARGVNGVRKVVRVFELITEEELRRITVPPPTDEQQPTSMVDQPQ